METQVPFQLHNMGSTKTTIKQNNKTTKSSIEWKGNYDGQLADIHISVNNNGRNENMNIKLNNNDLMNLFGHPVVEEQIDERLLNDFFSDRPMPFVINEQPTHLTIKKNNTNKHTKNTKNNKNNNNKNKNKKRTIKKRRYTKSAKINKNKKLK
jgi:hypothetical protein